MTDKVYKLTILTLHLIHLTFVLIALFCNFKLIQLHSLKHVDSDAPYICFPIDEDDIADEVSFDKHIPVLHLC